MNGASDNALVRQRQERRRTDQTFPLNGGNRNGHAPHRPMGGRQRLTPGQHAHAQADVGHRVGSPSHDQTGAWEATSLCMHAGRAPHAPSLYPGNEWPKSTTVNEKGERHGPHTPCMQMAARSGSSYFWRACMQMQALRCFPSHAKSTAAAAPAAPFHAKLSRHGRRAGPTG